MARPSTKRNEIIGVALRLFAEKGVKATTIRDIAHAAGVTEGALYRHFTSKEDLARYLFASGAELLYGRLEAATEGLTHAPERLRAMVCAFFDFADREPGVFGYVMARHYEGLGEIPATQRLPRSLFVAAIAQGVEQGEFRVMDPELAAAMVTGVAIQAIFFLKRGVIQQAPGQVRCEVCNAIHRLLAA